MEYGRTLARRVREIGRRPHANEFVEFDCFRRQRLRIPPKRFLETLATFRRLQDSGPDQRTEYRRAFWFQFPTRFDGLAEVREYYKESPIRSLELMELARPHIDFDGKRVLSLGFHNGAEMYWLYDKTTARVHGVDANPTFCAFAKFLVDSYGLGDRISLAEEDVIDHILTTNQSYDVVVAHGLLYMLWDPFLFLRAIRARLRDGGVCSLEVYVLPEKKPVMQYLGDGSGWGDTFGFSLPFLQRILPAFGFLVEKVLDYRGRKLFILRKGKQTAGAGPVDGFLRGATNGHAGKKRGPAAKSVRPARNPTGKAP